VTTWVFEKISSEARAKDLATEVASRFPDLELAHDVTWLHDIQTSSRDASVFALSARSNGQLEGFAPFIVRRASVSIGLGEFSLMSKRVERFSIDGGPLFQGDHNGISDCFASLADHLPKNSVIFMRGVAEGSGIHDALMDRYGALRAAFHVVPFGPVYQRCRIAWTGSFERYLESLGKVSRKDLRRTLKKAPEVLGGELRLERYRDPRDVARFVHDAAEVSAKTYQAKLGVGLMPSKATFAELDAAAARGRFLGHVLFLGETPIAFHLGLLNGRCFYMINGGYDPTHAKAQLGMYLFLRVLQDLEAERVPVRVLDYLYGDSPYKLRTSNQRVPERHYYLMKRDAPGTLLAAALRTADAGSRAAGAVLDRMGLKAMMKGVLRSMMAKPKEAYKSYSTRAMVAFGAFGDFAPMLAAV
jgi:hypothetical protein